MSSVKEGGLEGGGLQRGGVIMEKTRNWESSCQRDGKGTWQSPALARLGDYLHVQMGAVGRWSQRNQKGGVRQRSFGSELQWCLELQT